MKCFFPQKRLKMESYCLSRVLYLKNNLDINWLELKKIVDKSYKWDFKWQVFPENYFYVLRRNLNRYILNYWSFLLRLDYNKIKQAFEDNLIKMEPQIYLSKLDISRTIKYTALAIGLRRLKQNINMKSLFFNKFV